MKLDNDSKRFKDLMNSLKNIERKLDVLITLQKVSVNPPSLGEDEKKILKLCDKNHTVDDMAKETGKKKGNVRVILYNLRKKAQINSVKIKNKTVYERI